MNINSDIDAIRAIIQESERSVLRENTAQRIYHHYLNEILNNQGQYAEKWIWELLQNACDAAEKQGVDIRLHISDNLLHFAHTGKPFTPDEINHLIYHGTTKIEDEEKTGQFGYGFISTHLLSASINIKGMLHNDSHSNQDCLFDFDLTRDFNSPKLLNDSMAKSSSDFRESLKLSDSHSSVILQTPFRTIFEYKLAHNALLFANSGIALLTSLAPLILAFNRSINKIEIKNSSAEMSFERSKNYNNEGDIWQLDVELKSHERVEVYQVIGSSCNDEVHSCLLAKKEDGRVTLQSEDKLPKIFISYPIVGTDTLPLPTIMNSTFFKPDESRKMIHLGDQGDGPENIRLLRCATELSKHVLCYAASKRISGLESQFAFDLSNIPDWAKVSSVIDITKSLLKYSRELPLVQVHNSKWIAPCQSRIPYSDNMNCIDRIYNSASHISEVKPLLPVRAIAPRWAKNLHSWKDLFKDDINVTFSEALDLYSIAEIIDNAGSIADLQAILSPDTDAFEWLNDYLSLVSDCDCNGILENYKILPNQNDTFCILSSLRRDVDIDQELKSIAANFHCNLRDELLASNIELNNPQIQLKSFSETNAVEQTVLAYKKLCKEDSCDINLLPSSVSLFAWICNNTSYLDHLADLPVPTEQAKENNVTLVKLSANADKLPLAPKEQWPKEFLPFWNLFPKHLLLNSELHRYIDSPDIWHNIASKNYIRLSPLYTSLQRLPTHSDDGIEYFTTSPISVFEIAFLKEPDGGIREAARKNKDLAKLLIKLLLCAVMNANSSDYEKKQVECECEKRESLFVYPSTWHTALTKTKWLPIKSNASAYSQLGADSLLKLIGSDEELLRDLEGDGGSLLLDMLSINRMDFQLRLIAQDEQDRATAVSALRDITQAVGGIDNFAGLAQEIREHPDTYNNIMQRRMVREKIKSNQQIGELVENLLRQALTNRGITVRRTGIGSDFEVESDFIDDNTEILIEIGTAQSSILIEVKSTRTDHVKMTPIQTKTACKENERYALCVVPLLTDNPTDESIRDLSKFVCDIGGRLQSLLDGYLEVESATQKACHQKRSDVAIEIIEGQVRFKISDTVWNDGLNFEQMVENIMNRS